MRGAARGHRAVPAPAEPGNAAALPSVVTVFVSEGERSAVLRALRRLHPDRRVALLRALKVDTAGEKS